MSGDVSRNVEKCRRIADNLRRLQMDVVTPFDEPQGGEMPKSERLQHLVALLFQCNAAVFLENWNTHRDTRTAKFIADQYGIQSFWEQDFRADESMIDIVHSEIVAVTGLEPGEYCGMSKTTGAYLARLLFVHYARENGVSVSMICKTIHRNKFTVFRCLRKFNEEYQYNRQFQKMADKIKERL